MKITFLYNMLVYLLIFSVVSFSHETMAQEALTPGKSDGVTGMNLGPTTRNRVLPLQRDDVPGSPDHSSLASSQLIRDLNGLNQERGSRTEAETSRQETVIRDTSENRVGTANSIDLPETFLLMKGRHVPLIDNVIRVSLQASGRFISQYQKVILK